MPLDELFNDAMSTSFASGLLAHDVIDISRIVVRRGGGASWFSVKAIAGS